METELINQKGKCCRCEAPLAESKHLNFVTLNQRATWEYPVWGNVLSGQKGLACAYLCDPCMDECQTTGEGDRPLKYAAEFRGDEIVYHDVATLETPAVAKYTIALYEPDETEDGFKIRDKLAADTLEACREFAQHYCMPPGAIGKFWPKSRTAQMYEQLTEPEAQKTMLLLDAWGSSLLVDFLVGLTDTYEREYVKYERMEATV